MEEKNYFWLQYKKNIISYANKVAIEDENGHSITYRRLDELSNRVASYIKRNEKMFSQYICISSRKTISTVIGVLGVLKAGRTYIPIATDMPEERKKYIYGQVDNSVIDYDDLNIIIQEQNSEESEEKTISVNSSAYVIYTSGSTGKPKGVEITYDNMINTFVAVNKTFGINSEDVILNLAPFDFDLSVYDILNTLMIGAKLIITTNGKNVLKIANILSEKKITVWNSVPMVMEMVIELLSLKKDERIFESIKVILLSGDKTYVSLAEKIKHKFVNAKIISLGGATECSIWSNFYIYTQPDMKEKVLPYGYALSGQELVILDEEYQICEINKEGEIFIGGKGVAKGYFNDAIKTEQAFVTLSNGKRYYKTGDLGILTSEGYIVFKGRSDRQRKVRGYRVELEEIEHVINSFIDTRCAVGVVNDRIVAKVVDYPGINIAQIQNKIKEFLPNYMIPNDIFIIKKMELTQNGKIDYKKMF